VDMLSLRMLTESDLQNIINKVVESNQTLAQENGSKVLGRMMNLVMGEVRGRADPRQVTELLRTRLEQVKT
jgi:Glu-tRNA(Gln) amidotransferase subunit E-like FAD-binding protein